MAVYTWHHVFQSLHWTQTCEMYILSSEGKYKPLDQFCLPDPSLRKISPLFRMLRTFHQKICPLETFVQLYWEFLKIHKRSICKPKNCDSLDLSTSNPLIIFSSGVFQTPLWSPGQGPSLKPLFYQLPSFSTAIAEYRIKLPERKGRSKPTGNIWHIFSPQDL